MRKISIKSTTSIEYTRRIQMAVDYIEQNIDQTISLDDVAQASHFSSYHFHRIFHALMNETVSDFISRKRMEKAVCKVLYKLELSITEVSEQGGFSSSANFAKAFKLYFGVSASELRNISQENRVLKNNDVLDKSKIGKIYSKYGKDFKPWELYSQFITQAVVFDSDKLEALLMKIKLKNIKEKQIVFLSSPNGYDLDSVYATWDKIIHWAELNNIENNYQVKYAICHDNPIITPENKCRYDAAIEVSSNCHVKAPFTKSSIPAGKYAIAYYKDSADKISNFMTELCSHWFPDSGYEPDDYPPIFNYLNDSKKDGFVEMDIYLKVKELVPV